MVNTKRPGSGYRSNRNLRPERTCFEGGRDLRINGVNGEQSAREQMRWREPSEGYPRQQRAIAKGIASR